MEKNDEGTGQSSNAPSGDDSSEKNPSTNHTSDSNASDNDSAESVEPFEPLEIVDDYTVDLGEEDDGLEGVYG